MGFQFIAIGGLLRKIPDTARWTRAAREQMLSSVLARLRAAYPNDWLFALGVLHPRRIAELVRYRTWAVSPYWLFQYEQDETATNSFLKG
jgi:hypothetical protein